MSTTTSEGKGWTPGPWRVKPIASNEGGCRSIQHYVERNTNARNAWYGLATTDGLADDEQDAANANLIAAAPDLYDALIVAQAVLRGDGMTKSALVDALTAVNAALRKAEGRST
jgi:hypothetical protein